MPFVYILIGILVGIVADELLAGKVTSVIRYEFSRAHDRFDSIILKLDAIWHILKK